LLVLLLACGPLWARAADYAASFDAANRLYAEGKFQEALAAYGKIIQAGQASAAVYFNLGNAFFKAGQIGRAIIAYEHAKELGARDPDVLANLQFARNQVQGPTVAPGKLGQWLGRLSLNEWTVLAAVLVWLWFLLLILPQWQPRLRSSLRAWLVSLGVGAALVCACLATRYYELRLQPTAVIISNEATLHQAPLADSPDAGTVHDGAELRVLDQKNDWLQVSTGSRRIGWVRREDAVMANVN